MTHKSVLEMIICHFALVVAACGPAASEQPLLQVDASRVLYDFDKPEVANKWQIVNDGVMGGRSSSRLTISDDGTAHFSGNLSLENNGGFASVRSRPAKLELKPEQEIVVRARGDGRKYTFNLYVAQRRMAFSYQAEFETKSGQWIDVRLPIAQFVAKSFGQRVEGSVLDSKQVDSVGILIGDKIAGPFDLQIDWIKLEVPE